MYGKHHTVESKLKNSISRKGKCCGKNNGASKAVLQLDFNNNIINEFNCIADALKYLNKNPRQPGQICNCCNGKAKTAYGFKWEYKNKKDKNNMI